MRADWKDGERVRSVEVTPESKGHYRVRVDAVELAVEVQPLAAGAFRVVTDQGAVLAEVTAQGALRFVRLGAMDFVLERARASRTRRRSAAADGGLEAPMPGVVTRVMVKPGDAVSRGQPLVAVEAMKMEHLVRAPRDGRIKRIAAVQGQMVTGGKALVELEEAP